MSLMGNSFGALKACFFVACLLTSPALAQRFFWAQRIGDRIVSADAAANTTTTILQWPTLDEAVGLALAPVAGKLYWAQSIGDRIVRSNLDGSSVQTIAQFPVVDGPRAIALDIPNGKIYWAQQYEDRIRRMNLDGSSAQTILAWPQVDEAVSLAIDSAGGKIYWAQLTGDRLQRANLDGTNVETLLQWPQLDDPTSIALDTVHGKIYWVQAFGDRLQRADLSGTNAELLLEWPQLDDAVSLTVDAPAGKIYWAQLFNDQVVSANLDGSSVQSLFAWPRLDDPVALVLVPPSGPLVPDPSGLIKSRFISFVPQITGIQAIRVRLVSLHHVSPPYAGGPSVPFTSFEGQVRWVGPPADYPEATSGSATFRSSYLQCTPHYRDWSTVGLLHVLGSAIVPSSTYEVEALAISCQGNETGCTAVSGPLTIKTTRWADLEEPYNPPSTTAQPDLADVAALVNKFKSAPGAPGKARALLAGDDIFGMIAPHTMSVDLSFAHIAACLDAFRGNPYQYAIQSCP